MGPNPRIFEEHIAFEPLAVSKADAMRMIAMPKLVQRWLYHGWVEVVRPGGRGCETIIDFASLRRAYDRYRSGEHPPLLPSEVGANESIGLRAPALTGNR